LKNMTSTLQRAFLAGAAGTLALEAATYVDVAVRGRAPSSVPETVVGKVASRVGVDALAESREDETAQHRRSGVGAIFGYATGLGVALLASPLFRRRALPASIAGIAIGATAMTLSDVGATAIGATDPRSWGAAGWLADAIPHAIYGITVAAVLDATVPRDRSEP
jgi:hypothetical protein